MPLTHERTFRVRHYECDAHGHVSPANHLRYMQETAYAASSAAGYDMVGYSSLSRLWLIRTTEIKFFHPLIYGDQVIVRTWVEDFRRVRSIRAYELRTGTGEMVARAWSDWIFLDPVTNSPCTIPPEMVAAFKPRILPPDSLPRKHFPGFPSKPPGSFLMSRQVEWRDLDALRHANNAVYLAFLEEAAINAAAHYGWTLDHLQHEKISLVISRAVIDYLQSAVLGDLIEVETWISNPMVSTYLRHFLVRRVPDQAVLCQAHVDYQCVDLRNGNPANLPAAFKQDFALHISEESGE